MGSPLITHEQDVKEMKKLVEKYPVLKRYISHHIKNSLAGIQCGIALGKPEVIENGASHILDDLDKVGL